MATSTLTAVQVIELRRRTLDLERRTTRASGPEAQHTTSIGAAGTAEPPRGREITTEAASGGGDREWARDPKVHHAVKQALALARQLAKAWTEEGSEASGSADVEDDDESPTSGEGGNGSGDRELVESCRQRLEEISSHLRRLDLPSFCRPAASFKRRDREGEAERSGHTGGAPTWTTSTSTCIPPAPHRATNKRSASDSRTREVQLHQQLHEDMSEEILHMARGLKKNALRQRDKLDKTSAQLEEAEHHLESNVANAKTRNKQAKVFYKRNWATSCAGYMMLLWVLIITAIILIVIRMSSFVGYTATSGGAAAAASNTAATDTMAQAHQEL